MTVATVFLALTLATKEPTMPAWILAALAGLAAALGIAVTIAPFALPFARKFLDEHVAAKDVELLRAAVKGAYLVVSRFAPSTSTTIDDDLAKILALADKEFEAARGKPMTPAQKTQALHVAVTMHADKVHPDLRPGDPLSALQRLTASIAAAGSGATAR